jgi:hypothetical protein
MHRPSAHTPSAVRRDLVEAPLQVRYSHPRRAHARRSWLCVRSSLNNIRFSRHTDRMTEPRRADGRCSWASVHSCIAKIVFSPASVRAAIQERGASAPRGYYQRQCNGDSPTHRWRSAEQARLDLRKRVSHTHGGLTPAAPVSARDKSPRTCAVSGLQARSPNHGGLTPAALFRRAFVHRKNRFFAGRRSYTNTRAGGVSPPWEPCTRGQRLKITQSRSW